ncbi:MAG: transglutaminase domain-containing protein, partial [Firmicutes bacterium]|nr:transglutaminase domain-containing protein [Bacillota bacterium]
MASQYLVEVFGEKKVETWFNLIDAVMAGEDTFACPDTETYNWVMGQFPNKCFPVINPVMDMQISYAWDRDHPVKNGIATFTYLVPREEVSAKITEFAGLVEDILNETMDPGDTDFEKALSLYLYFQKNYTYDDQAAEDNNNGRADYVSSYRLLTGKTGICHEISTAYSYLLMQAGVEATTVMGSNHEWSLIRLNGKNYHIDPTYVLSMDPGDLRYFLMTDEKRCEDGEFHSGTFTYCSAYSQDHPHPDYAADDETFQDLWSGYFDSFDHENQIL